MRRELFTLGPAAAFALWASLAPAQEAIIGGGVGGGTAAPVGACAIASVSLSPASFPGGFPWTGLVGVIGVGTSGPCGAAWLSLTGTDAANPDRRSEPRDRTASTGSAATA